MTMLYNNPTGDSPTASTVGEQIRTDDWDRVALIEAARTQFFTPLSTAQNMPRNYGKTIKKYHYLPLLDDRNINDQGIDADGSTTTHGNLYGGSKDIGLIAGRLPTLGEEGGRVNRVGTKRILVEASLEDLGYFSEWSREAIDFDTDSEIYGHFSRELVQGASEVSEDVLQMDLLNGAGVLVYAGGATNRRTVTGEGSTPSRLTYKDIVDLGITLDDNRTPKQTRILTGSRLTDTRTLKAARVLFAGTELQYEIQELQRPVYNTPVFIPANQYASQDQSLNGEIGSIDQFRIVINPEMQHWSAGGADATGGNLGYRVTDDSGTNKYDVFPLMCVGEGSFTTIGFQTAGVGSKYQIMVKVPGVETADKNDPYGRTGFISIQWYYATLIERPERLAVLHVVAAQ